jgi:hypothetical protein
MTAVKREDHERQIRAALKSLRESYDPDEKKDDIHRQWGFIRSVSWSDPTIENKIEYTVLVHGLTDRGLRLVRSFDLDLEGQAKSFQEFSPDHVDHELRINDFIDLTRAELGEIGLELIVERSNIKGKTISPDLLLYVYNPQTDIRSAPIFVEYEKQKRGKWDDGKPQVIRKIESLASYYNSDLCQKEFGFRKFYVIIILRTQRKANFLLKDLVDRGIKKSTFLVTAEPTLRPGILQARLKTPSPSVGSLSLLDL